MAPSGVQKERMREADMFVLDERGDVLETPEARPPPYKPPKLSECSPLFMAVRSPRTLPRLLHAGQQASKHRTRVRVDGTPSLQPENTAQSRMSVQAYELRGAGAVLHSHSINAVMATMLQPTTPGKGCCVGEFRVTNLEMIKVCVSTSLQMKLSRVNVSCHSLYLVSFFILASDHPSCSI